MSNENSNGTARLQSWLTPALTGAGLLLMSWILTEVQATRADVKTVRADVQIALRAITKHQTVLELNGLLEPRPRIMDTE